MAWSIVLLAGLAAWSPIKAQSLHDVHQGAGVPCAACHQEAPPAVAPPNGTCIACHGTMLEDIEGRAPSSPDPHRSPHLGPGEIPACTECHKVHSPSEVTCVQCHRGFEFNIR